MLLFQRQNTRFKTFSPLQNIAYINYFNCGAKKIRQKVANHKIITYIWAFTYRGILKRKSLIGNKITVIRIV